jgi:transposase
MLVLISNGTYAFSAAVNRVNFEADTGTISKIDLNIKNGATIYDSEYGPISEQYITSFQP